MHTSDDRAYPAYVRTGSRSALVDEHFTLGAACVFSGFQSTVVLDLSGGEREVHLMQPDAPGTLVYGGLTVKGLVHQLEDECATSISLS